MLSLIKTTSKHLGIFALIGSAVALGMHVMDETTSIPEEVGARIPVLKGAIESSADFGESLATLGRQSYEIAADTLFPSAQVNAQQKEARLKLNEIEQKIADNQRQQDRLKEELAKLHQDKQGIEKVVHPMKRLLPDSVNQGFNFMALKAPLPPLPDEKGKAPEDCACP